MLLWFFNVHYDAKSYNKNNTPYEKILKLSTYRFREKKNPCIKTSTDRSHPSEYIIVHSQLKNTNDRFIA